MCVKMLSKILNFNSSHTTLDAEFCGWYDKFVAAHVAKFREGRFGCFMTNRAAEGRIAIPWNHDGLLIS